MTRFITLLAAAFFVLAAALSASAAPLVAHVDVSSQTMTVYENGRVTHRWAVSTARKGKVTPRGTYSAQWLSRHHKSSRYNNAPMPYSIFYSGNYAIHGTYQTKYLGRPASAGCIRLHPEHAAILFRKVSRVGLGNMRVVIRN